MTFRADEKRTCDIERINLEGLAIELVEQPKQNEKEKQGMTVSENESRQSAIESKYDQDLLSFYTPE